jgi:uncharacterized membrane protein YvbJ
MEYEKNQKIELSRVKPAMKTKRRNRLLLYSGIGLLVLFIFLSYHQGEENKLVSQERVEVKVEAVENKTPVLVPVVLEAENENDRMIESQVEPNLEYNGQEHQVEPNLEYNGQEHQAEPNQPK